MSAKKIGGILVFTGKQDIDDIVEGGQRLGGEITKEIILSILTQALRDMTEQLLSKMMLLNSLEFTCLFAREYSDYRKVGTDTELLLVLQKTQMLSPLPYQKNEEQSAFSEKVLLRLLKTRKN